MAILGDSTYCPDIPLDSTRTWRLRKSAYGDGYEQRTLDGINALNVSWSATWSNRPSSVIYGIESLILAAKGGPMDYQTPGGAVRKVVCDEWSVTWERKNYGSGAVYATLRATFSTFNGAWQQ